MLKRIVYTRPDGGVNVCHPAKEIKAFMTNGGGWFDNYPNGVNKAIAREIEKQINNGRNKAITVRFVHALAFGGCTDAEFYEIIRDRDCGHRGTGFELWDDIPLDRWFRNAWVRSHNGGPINIDLTKARKIQAGYIKQALSKRQEVAQEHSLLIASPQSFPQKELYQLEQKLLSAGTPEEIRAITIAA